MIDDEYDVDPDQPSDHPDAPESPFDGNDENIEEDYEDVEAWLLMTVGRFETRWDKAWNEWMKTHDIPEDEAADMCNGSPYDEEGNIIPEIEKWYGIYNTMKNAVEKEFGVRVIVDVDGTVFAQHKLADGDTITVP